MDTLKSLGDQINSSQVAELLGVRRDAFNNARIYLSEFPRSTGKYSKSPMYSRREVKAWMQGKDVKALIRAARKSYRPPEKVADTEIASAAFNRAAKQFLTRPLTQQQRDQQAFKRLASRATKPKTTRITLVPDWTLDDRKAARRNRERKENTTNAGRQ